MFKLLRFYSAISFIVIFLAAAILTLFYRQVTMHWIEHLAQTSNLSLAQTALTSVEPELGTYLSSGAGIGSRGLPAGLASHIHRMTRDTTLSRIDIYDRNGLLVFSTQTTRPVSARGRDPAFLAALSGRASGAMTFQSAFDRLIKTAPANNLMRTYTPIRGDSPGAVLGVFETHADMSHLVEESDRILFHILAGAELILALLYGILFFVVRHARNIITAQQQTVLERTASLEALSEGLLKGEESRKKKIATDLHEGLAQTLSAIKANVESDRRRTPRTNRPSMDTIVPVLQHAIHEVRTIATELRPSSLDDLGLLPTINWFCREFELRHPEIRIRREISLPENMIPARLKIEIYRIIESAFRNIAKYSKTDQISFLLHPENDTIHLLIGDTPTMRPEAGTISRLDPGANPQLRFAEIRERTSLSGGTFSTTQENSGWITLHSSWACGG
jgi:signal transduction histidine kinase